ncbi:MAG TPA: dipeptide ABC transporter ATP-binding protein [Mesorhizobium sp.]|jgi:peptide/nickel transport system ATP-binding protein|nr:dipeptide ABC transporter ATP-binding protein [Mesorhizobium sp.]
MTLLAVENLSVAIRDRILLDGVGLAVGAGETVALVGESGSGKSLTALAVMRLLPGGAQASGRIRLDGHDLLALSEERMCRVRGRMVGMVFQEPMTALNPVKTIGEQVAEGIRFHLGVGRAEAEERAGKMLDRVGLPAKTFPLSRYPHELSGGQRQRVVTAIACACEPKLLIADEPTTALDVVLQAQILDLLRDLVTEQRMGLLLISHDLAVVADMADRIAVMREGQVVEDGFAVPTLTRPRHAYTRQLAEASMNLPIRRQVVPGGGPPLLEVRNLVRAYRGRRRSLFSRAEPVHAVDDVSFAITPGQSVALVGRSGCGKSTLARLVLALDRPQAGEARLAGESLHDKSQSALRPLRRNIQVVFQDPYGSFDPRLRVEKLVAEPLHLLDEPISTARRRELVAQALAEVGLPADGMDRYIHEFSGGQRQRLAIARAVILRPKLLVADEPVSALDVSVRGQVLELFSHLNEKLGMAMLFITHDLQVARAVADEVLVMHEGRIVERGPVNAVLDDPQTEPARALVAAAPDLAKAIARREALQPTAGAASVG